MFHFVSSTGRTATTFISHKLNELNGVLGLHESSLYTNNDREHVLPALNLENYSAYKNPNFAIKTVAQKRSSEILVKACNEKKVEVIVDVAYYNASIASALLRQLPDSRMIGIIRGARSFVRSAAFVEGEDVMAVGWPEPEKPLTAREKFIGMGRIRPVKGTKAYLEWDKWGTIERNTWLWLETNKLIMEAKRAFPDRVGLLDFSDLRQNPELFWNRLIDGLNINVVPEELEMLMNNNGPINVKSTGYQVDEFSSWKITQQRLVDDAQSIINNLWEDLT